MSAWSLDTRGGLLQNAKNRFDIKHPAVVQTRMLRVDSNGYTTTQDSPCCRLLVVRFKKKETRALF